MSKFGRITTALIIGGLLIAADPKPRVEVQELESGLDASCKAPPDHYEIFRLWKDSCMHLPGTGKATCTYVAKVMLGKEWICAMGLFQDGCKADWSAVKVMCEEWKDEDQKLLDKLE